MILRTNRTTTFGLFLLVLCAFAGGCSRRSADDKEAMFLKRGQALVERKDYPRAAIEFYNAMQALPKDAEPYYQLGRVYIAQQDLGRAVQFLKKATELNPAHADAQLWLAGLMTNVQDKNILEDAEGRAKGVLAATPENPQALDTLAAAELRLGKVDDAVKHLEEAFVKAPKNVGAAVNLARMKAAQKDLAGAEQVLKKLAADSPKSVSAALLLAHFYFTGGRNAEGETQVRRALQLDSKNPDALVLLAAVQMGAGNADQAEQTYRHLSSLPLPGKEYKTAYALHLFRVGKRSHAVTEFEKIVKQNPDNREYRNLLVSAYVKQGQYGAAEKVLAAALKRNANDIDALLQRADFYTRAGKLEEAGQDLRSVLHFKPDSAPAHFALAKVYGFNGSDSRQRQELSDAVRLDPGLLAARLELGLRLLAFGAAEAALDLLDHTPERQKNAVAYLVTRNRVLLAQGKDAEVSKNLSHSLALARSADLVYQDALLKLKRKDYAGARQAVNEVLKTYPGNAAVVETLAESYSSQGNMPKALEVLREHASEWPKSAPLHYVLGVWLQRAGLRGEARGAFADAVNAAPNYVLAVLALAELDFQDGNMDGARRRLAPVLSSHPENVQARLLLASTEEKAGNQAAAIVQYRAIIERDPKNLAALNNLACALARDNPDEALKYAQSAIEVAPEEPAAQDTLGWIYYRKGIYREAVTYLRRAVDKQATPPRQYHLGMAYAKVGEKRLAIQYVSAALDKDSSLGIER
jgi:tetratricopeptide (TPR) repeat protein